MKLTDFDFDLPQDLIAQKPSGKRGDDRLMLLDRKNGSVFHHQMNDLPDLIMPGTLMIFNNSKVRRARCYGIKETTGRNQEFMFLNQLDKEGFLWNTMVKSAKQQKNGMRYQFADGTVAKIVDFPGNEKTEFRALKFDFPLDEKWFEKNGHIPLPPYIKREDTEEDSERYQNVYAKETGSAACPTAGLHFTEEMLSCLAEKNIERDFVTLHVGLGTFLPVRESIIENHKMHEEVYTISESTAEKINKAKREGRPILAVGTTSVRTLESSADEKGFVKSGTSSTRIFMYPGYKFKVVDQMFTNFHTPESTLIMLVSAFCGLDNTMKVYNIAVKEKYRFFSFGDAMFIQ